MIRELIDADLEAVAGGSVNLVNLTNITPTVQSLTQHNTANAFSFAGFGGEATSVIGSQSNVGANSNVVG